MAAADSIPQFTNYVPLLVATLPVILAPIVAWVLGRSRISREAATIDYLDKRLDFLERLSKLDTQLTEGPVRLFLDMEIEYYRTFLRQPPTFIPRGAEAAVAVPQSRLARFFLIGGPALSERKRIFKGLFYFFFASAMLAILTASVKTLFNLELENKTVSVLTVLFSLLGIGFYFGLALLFRHWARYAH
jgi:hypothetical protein